ncbi:MULTISPECIES: SpaH/EbpB family LPXTG-anchored major pilin [Clostridia]|uniref:SpaH/EbpB family LPXTG-anchored major pilin n=1 Tax=Clostridia TaxID=186801 RepID=UPI000EB2A7D8|nr:MULTISPECIES: SpaH/EbpB family LPXTG-anchored major pilin [Clostridia]RKQ30205.1 isopeptide-forming domain-containing fimbrial protein [Ruminococcus sp. B05]TAP35310.1 isopeptide-forming domain-containing fimbrial protein [Mediterraneibacter sp. gm002]
MKKMKKIMAVLMTVIMTMAMAVTAFADEGVAAATGTNTLTVSVKSTTPAQDLNGQTINLYKLFDVTESGTTESKNYAYTVNTATGYKDAIKSALGTSFTGTTDEEYAAAVLALKDTEGAVQKFANDFTAEALTKNLSATENSGKIAEENKTSYTFNNLAAGYYLVYVTGGKEIQSSLVTVDETTTTVNLKTEAPSIEKTADKATVNIGDVVTYTVKGSIPDTTGYAQYVYKIHDELSTGLDFVNDATGTALGEGATTVNVTVAFTDNSVTAAGTTPTAATLDIANNRKMSLDLSEWVRDNQANKGKEFTVTYYAKVNKDAVVTEKNKAQLEYGNKPGETTTTTPSEAKTPTYPLDILKIKKGTEEILAGAHFTLYASTTAGAIDESKPIKVTKVDDGKYSYAADQTSTDPSVITDMVTVASKIEGQGYNLHINGLAAGTYYLKETKAPDGYNKLTEAIKVTITKSTTADENDWTLTVDKGTVDGKIVKVENSTGSLLPSTGGRGAIAFAVIAALLVFGVAVSFIRDKRKEA